MISRIYAKGLKGMDFDIQSGKLNLTKGPVGSGKSVRTIALSILVTGSVPGSDLIGRQIGDVFDTLASADEMVVGAVICGKEFERRVKRAASGSISQKFSVDGQNTQKNLFEIAMHETGIRIADLSAFTALSDQKKVAYLLELYPPKGDIADINRRIAHADESANKTAAESKGIRSMIAQFQATVANTARPSGTIPEIQAAIKQCEAELDDARKELTEMAVTKAKVETAQQVATTQRETMPIETPVSATPRGISIHEQLLLEVSNILDSKKRREDFAGNIPGNFGGVIEKTLEIMERNEAVGKYAAAALETLEGVKGVLDKQECAATCPASMKAKVGLKKLTKMAGEIYA